MHKLGDFAMPNCICIQIIGNTAAVYVQTNLKSTHFSNLFAYYL